jgi:hypothetical protein
MLMVTTNIFELYICRVPHKRSRFLDRTSNPNLACRHDRSQKFDFLLGELEVGDESYALLEATEDGELAAKWIFPEVKIEAETI